jgi:hypothetical protein
MRIYIEHGAHRREIAGPFNLAGTPEDLRRIAEQILLQVEDDRPSCHVAITAVQPALGDTRPVPWSRAA